MGDRQIVYHLDYDTPEHVEVYYISLAFVPASTYQSYFHLPRKTNRHHRSYIIYPDKGPDNSFFDDAQCGVAVALCFSGDHDHIVCPDKDPDDGFLDDAQCVVAVALCFSGDHDHHHEDPNCHERDDYDYVTERRNYSHHLAPDTPIHGEVDVSGIVLEHVEGTVSGAHDHQRPAPHHNDHRQTQAGVS